MSLRDAAFLYGEAAFTGTSNSADQWRVVLFLVLLTATVIVARICWRLLTRP
ncbi:hypothetical protein [Nocardia crassostreae]|uniref:hypothetical protein n=1 Tax=Nocardia crassostreae TaxID=53428 RepID=UPI000A8A8A55|nr:hypothetical protein [Nocardia crassostreae]